MNEAVMKVFKRCVCVLTLLFVMSGAMAMAASLEADAASKVSRTAVGYKQLSMPIHSRGAALKVSLWYPTSASAPLETIQANKVFQGVSAIVDPPVAKGVHPVLLLAHGGLRSAPQLSSWVAKGMASRGYIVLVPHPPKLAANSAALVAIEPILRAMDLSLALTELLKNPEFGKHFDLNNVSALGFLLGGHSVLALAGAEFDIQAYVASCGQKKLSLDCGWFEEIGFDLMQADTTDWPVVKTDNRIGAALVVDPELSHTFTPASLQAIKTKLSVLNLGGQNTALPELQAEDLAMQIPAASYSIMQDASTFSSFSQCTDRAEDILANAGEDTRLCSDGIERSRAEIHDALLEKFDVFFRR